MLHWFTQDGHLFRDFVYPLFDDVLTTLWPLFDVVLTTVLSWSNPKLSQSTKSIYKFVSKKKEYFGYKEKRDISGEEKHWRNVFKFLEKSVQIEG